MRFDLEIPALNNIELTYIKGGKTIPNGAAPLVYCDMNKKDMFPSDFISAEVMYYPREYITGGYSEVHGPSIAGIRSDQFIITNMAQYMYDGGGVTPLFYKHIVSDPVKQDAIKIVDFFGIEIDKNSYVVEEEKYSTTIYINKQDRILFVEYVAQNTINKTLLNLVPVFQEAGWDDVINGDIVRHKYILRDNRIDTSHDETLYIAYLSDTKLFNTVRGNVEDPWYINVLNVDFTYNGNRYWVPEYYTQQLNGDFRYKLIENKKCKSLFGKFIQSQYSIADNAQDSIYVYVKDVFQNKLKYAFTTNIDMDGKLYKENIYYRLISSFNIDGVIELPVDLSANDVAYITQYTDEPYYEYKGIDLNSSIADHIDYFVFYIKPNMLDTDFAIGHAVIGTGIEIEGIKFNSIEEYAQARLNSQSEVYNAYHVATVKINSNMSTNNYRLLRQTSAGNRILDKLEASKKTQDIIYKDIIDGVISIPTNDALVALIDLRRMIESGYVNYSQATGFDNHSTNYLNYIMKKLNDNLDVSTSAIAEINVR